MAAGEPGKGVIKPATRFSVSGTQGLEALDVRDRPDPRAFRLESRPDGEAGLRPVRGHKEAVHEAASNPVEGDEGPSLRSREGRAEPVQVGHGHRGDLAVPRHLDEVRQLREAVLAENPRGQVVEAARRAARGEEAALVPQGAEKPLPRDPGGVDVVRLEVAVPMPEPPGIRRPLQERHPFSSRSGRKYRMSRTLPRRSAGGFHAAWTRIPIRISSFVISPK